MGMQGGDRQTNMQIKYKLEKRINPKKQKEMSVRNEGMRKWVTWVMTEHGLPIAGDILMIWNILCF